MANLNPPQVTGVDHTVKIGESTLISDFFSVFDPDGDEIVQYSFLDTDASADSGYLSLNGVKLAAGEFHTIDAEDLANLRYVAGSVVGNEVLRIRANDGQFNSDTGLAIAYTVRENTTAPIFTGSNVTSVANEFIKVSSFFSGYDPDGWPTVRYKFRDLNARSNSGYFVLDGVRMASNNWFYVRAEDFDKLDYFTGTTQTRENLLGRMFDGELWSPVARSNFSTSPNRYRPVVNPLYIAKGASEEFQISELFTVSDRDGNQPKWFEFRDSSTQDDSGFITIDGVVQPAATWIRVEADNLENVTFTTGRVNRLDNISIKVSDGRFVSSAERAFVAVSTRPVVDPKPPLIFDGDETVQLVSIIDQSDDGPRNIRYRIFDASDNPFSARFELDSNFLDPGRVHTFDANTMERVLLKSGDFTARRLDEIYVQTFNGVKWSVWRSLKVRTEPRMYDALANVEDTVINARNSWRQWIPGSGDQPLRITYSFQETPEPSLLLFTQRLSNAERIEVRRVLDRVEEMLFIDFVEIADSFVDPLTGNQGGTIRIGHTGGDIAFEPNDTATAPWGGNILLSTAHILEDLAVGTVGHSAFLQLLGTALGLRHADTFFQVFNPLLFKWPLPDFTNDQRHTVMSDNPNPDNQVLDANGDPTGFIIPVEPTRFGIYDMYALQELYGQAPGSFDGDDVYGNTGDPDSLYDWTRKVPNFDFTELHDMAVQTSIVGDSGGNDTLDLSEMFVSSVIDLTPGSFSSAGEITFNFVDFFPATNNIAIGHDVVIENAIGGASDELIRGNFADNVLIGNEGDDILIGGGGSDRLVGGIGNDTYRWKLTDQNEEIDENLGGGIDRLVLNSHWAMDDITEDMTFMRNGNDLIIDLTFNGSLSQGEITIKDMGLGLSRVEILRLNYTSGDPVNIDLRSIFDAATTTAQAFQVTEDSTPFGLIAAPV